MGMTLYHYDTCILTVPLMRDALKLYIEDQDTIAKHFIGNDDGHCSAEEFHHLLYLFADQIGRSLLDDDAVKFRVGTPYFESIARYLCTKYPNANPVFKRFVP